VNTTTQSTAGESRPAGSADGTGGDDGAPLRAERLSKHYGKGKGAVQALVGVSFRVKRGEFVAIIGPSGSGKSTLLHLLAGLATPSSGSVHVDGQDLAAMNDRRLTLFRRRKIGLVFQAYNLIPSLSAEDNIRLPLLLERGGPADPARVEKIIQSLGLAQRRKHRPDQLSGGEQQRVAIGRAMVNDPAVILADEATGNLDTASSRRFCQLMHDLSTGQGRTILAVTHDPAVAAWARRVLVLRDGRIVHEVRPAEHADAKELAGRLADMVAGQDGGAA
jgi:putative ABC transport system ATP-binding protein